mgnify:CR=1 FL=1
MAITTSTNHVERALNKLLSQFGNSPKIRALLATYIAPIQAAELWLADTIAVVSINAGIGIVLDRIGAIVGRGRKGLADDDYRYALRAQIRINRSCGKAEDFIAVLKLSLNNDPAFSVECADAGIAAGQVSLHGAVPATVILVLWESLRRVKMAGVRLHFVYSLFADDETFTCASTWGDPSARGAADVDRGCGWTADATRGGHLAGEFST